MKIVAAIGPVTVKVIVIAMLLLAVFADHEYSYYTLLRWVVCGCSVYFAFTAYVNKRIGILIFFVATALLFNPLIKVWLQKSTWHVVDLGVAAVVALSIAFDFKKENR